MRYKSISLVLVLTFFSTACLGRGSSGTDSRGHNSWQASSELVEKLTKRDPKTNYYEEKVQQYSLPDPLIMSDGVRLTDAQMWQTKRRPEILELFQTHMYGRPPVGRPENMTFKVFDVDRAALAGLATRKQVAVRFTADKDGPSMDILIYLPNAAKKPVPTFVLLNFGGNHAIGSDPAIKLSESWMRAGPPAVVDNRATEQSRGRDSAGYPVENIIKRGYGLATIYYGDIDPDFDDGFKNGVHGFFDKLADGKRAPDAWGSIGAWAWGLSRAMDYFQTDSDIDHKRVAVLGHSRLGKTALWAGAQDERFALVISNNSGCGGAALSRRRFGETVRRINTSFPHWFCDSFKKYNDQEDRLPVDQHTLIALMAPRPVYVASADQDLWADPRGEFLSCKNAGPVYNLLGCKGLDVEQMPALNSPIQKGRIGYHIRTGGHGLTEYDWQQYMDFADRHLKETDPSSGSLKKATGQIRQSAHANPGLASKYAADKGIENDPDVIFTENFEQPSLDAIKARWENLSNIQIMSLSDDVPEASSGRHSLLMTHVGGKDTGGHLYRCLLPGYEQLYFRFYVKFDPNCFAIHHFVHMGGYSPPTPWPQGGAGIRPAGNERFTTGVEPYGEKWRWDFYSYWMGMRSSPDKASWGHDFINDESFRAEKGRWICVELMMKMNDPVTESNGEQAIWIDGKLWSKNGQVISHLGKGFPRGKWVWDSFNPDPAGEPFEGFQWRNTEKLNLNFLWLLLYITKAPPGYISKVWFDDIVVAKNYIGPINTPDSR